MEISVFNPILSHLSLKEALEFLVSQGVTSLELGCGGYPGTAHADARVLASSASRLKELKDTLDAYGVKVCALSVHGNPVHPDAAKAEQARGDFEAACILANKLEVDTLVTFSGCPGSPNDNKYPNWVTCPWPEEYLEILNYQWNEVLIPYWKSATQFAKNAGVKHIALEMHPGFCVYNPETLMRLRKAAGEMIGANFDPSHLIWQGIDPVLAIKTLGSAIYHFHAKDTAIDKYNTALNGVLDTKHYTDELGRSWIFRTVGYGSDTVVWKEMISALSKVGYTGAISIEHEDSLMTPVEGLKKAIKFIKGIIIYEPKPSTINWA
ncbi:MAG: sugar phosphate isomerase/epimerase [Clostridiales bacterium]|jgi:sugar phosphate isomerase/epimerase|nr:sugar phosphate isomerase/epimerase [Clostridiales bacterium]HOB64651.1 sugar phosphate isomerase/epimerase [Clostridia bacterium]